MYESFLKTYFAFLPYPFYPKFTHHPSRPYDLASPYLMRVNHYDSFALVLMNENNVLTHQFVFLHQVWSIVAGYIVIVIFWWTPLSANVLSSLSVPVWTLVLIHLASYAGKWKVLIFLIFLILLIVGLVEEWKGKRQRGELFILR